MRAGPTLDQRPQRILLLGFGDVSWCFTKKPTRREHEALEARTLPEKGNKAARQIRLKTGSADRVLMVGREHIKNGEVTYISAWSLLGKTETTSFKPPWRVQ